MTHLTELLIEDSRLCHCLQRMTIRHFVIRHDLDQFVFNLLTVDIQLLSSIADMIARQADNTLDVVDGRVVGVTEYHDITTLRLANRDDLGVDHRQANTVGKLVDEDKVAYVQCRLH